STSNKPNQESFLFECLDQSVEKYRADSRRLKRWTYVFRIALLVLSGTSTVLLGLSVQDSRYTIWSRNIALMLGAVSTFIVGLSAFWNIESYWMKQKVLFARVRALRERCRFLQAETGALTGQQTSDAFLEYRALMEDRIDYWEKATSSAASK